MNRSPLALLPILLFVLEACGASSEASVSATLPSQQPALHASSSASAVATPSGAPAKAARPVDRTSWTESGMKVPTRFNNADERRFFASCHPLMKLVLQVGKETKSRNSQANIARAVSSLEKDPAGMTVEDIRWCRDYMIASTRRYLAQMRAISPVHSLRSLGRAMANAHRESGSLCPASTPGLAVVQDPAWKCVRALWALAEARRFQFSLHTDKNSFIFRARGKLLNDGKEHLYALSGRVEKGAVVLGKVTSPTNGPLPESGASAKNLLMPVESQPTTPPWKIGQRVEVQITLITSDHSNLACAMKGQIANRYCAFEANDAPNARAAAGGGARKDASLLQPYVTTKGHTLAASGLWLHAALAAKVDAEDPKLPSPRFNAICEFHVQGHARLGIQWKRGGGWYSSHLWVGEVSSCRLRAR